jgi:O-antigen ligase
MDAIQRMFYFSLSLLLFLVFILKFKNQDNVALNKFILIPMLLFPITFFTSFFNNSASLLALQLSNLIIPFTIILQTIVMMVMLGEEKFFKVTSIAVVIVSTLFSVVGIFEVFQIKFIPLPSIIPPGSTLGHRSFAAEYLLSSLPFFLILNEYLNKDKKVFLMLAALANVSFLLFTRNRGAIVILIVITILYVVFILTRKDKLQRLRNVTATLLVLIVSFLISLIPVKGMDRPDLQSTASSIFDPDFRSNVFRIKFWETSLQMVEENPFTGVGVLKWSGYYPKYFGEYFNDDNLTYIHNIHAHNDFLEVFAENGIAAFVVFLFLYLSVGQVLYKKNKTNSNYFYLLLVFLIIAAFSLISFPNHKFSSYFLAAVATGTALVNLKGKLKYTVSIKFNYLKSALLVLIIAGGIFSYIKLKSEISFAQAMFLKERTQYNYMLQKLGDVSSIFYPYDASKQPIDYYRGIANYYLRRQSEALKNNLSAHQLAPFNPIVLRNLAGSYQLTGNQSKAVEVYNRIRQYFPNYIEAHINLLYLYSKTGQSKKEKELFEELLTKDPESPHLKEYKKKFSQ